MENTPLHAMKKEANWLPFVTLRAERNPLQRRKLAELHEHRNVDLLLQAQAHFIKAHDLEVTVSLFDFFSTTAMCPVHYFNVPVTWRCSSSNCELV